MPAAWLSVRQRFSMLIGAQIASTSWSQLSGWSAKTFFGPGLFGSWPAGSTISGPKSPMFTCSVVLTWQW